MDLSPGGVTSPLTALGRLTRLSMLLHPGVACLPGSFKSLLQTQVPFGYKTPEALQLPGELIDPGDNILSVGEADVAIHPRVLRGQTGRALVASRCNIGHLRPLRTLRSCHHQGRSQDQWQVADTRYEPVVLCGIQQHVTRADLVHQVDDRTDRGFGRTASGNNAVGAAPE